MQVHEYLFRSPYPSKVQVGTPQISSQKTDTATKEEVKTQNKKVQNDIKNAQVKAKTKDIKAPNTNKLDIYA